MALPFLMLTVPGKALKIAFWHGSFVSVWHFLHYLFNLSPLTYLNAVINQHFNLYHYRALKLRFIFGFGGGHGHSLTFISLGICPLFLNASIR